MNTRVIRIGVLINDGTLLISLLSEAITQHGIVTRTTHRCLRGKAYIEGCAVVVRDAGLLLVNWSADAFSDHKCTGFLTSVDGLNSLVQVTDDSLAGR